VIPIAKPFLQKEEAQAAYDTILTGWITQGPRVAEFEEKFAAYVGSKFAVAVSNCTTALHLSLIVAGIKKDDEVICPSMTYIATANAIQYVGATPVFAEVNAIDFNICPIDTEKKITAKTKAILIVHQVGMPANIDAFKNLCSKYNLQLIEDAACAVGSSYKKNKIGSHSNLVCFSFHPRKVITTGDGGMITTNDENDYNKLKLLRQHAMSVNDRVRHDAKSIIFEDHTEIGYNYRMTDIQAAVGLQQLLKLNYIVEQRRKIAFHYIEKLKNINWLQLPFENENCISNYQSFCVTLKENAPISRNDLMQKFLDANIATRRGVMTIHRETAYKNRAIYNLPISEKIHDTTIMLPLYVPMEIKDVDAVINLIASL
jgi:perosamine synthetase